MRLLKFVSLALIGLVLALLIRMPATADIAAAPSKSPIPHHTVPGDD